MKHSIPFMLIYGTIYEWIMTQINSNSKAVWCGVWLLQAGLIKTKHRTSLSRNTEMLIWPKKKIPELGSFYLNGFQISRHVNFNLTLENKFDVTLRQYIIVIHGTYQATNKKHINSRLNLTIILLKRSKEEVCGQPNTRMTCQWFSQHIRKMMFNVSRYVVFLGNLLILFIVISLTLEHIWSCGNTTVSMNYPIIQINLSNMVWSGQSKQ